MELKISNLSCTLGNKEVLKSISLQITNSKFTSVVGPNAAGKTTLLKCILGFLNYSGSISLDSVELRKLKTKNRAKLFSYVPQNKPYNSDFSVKEFVEMSYYHKESLFALKTNLIRQKSLLESLELCEVTHLSNKKLSQISGGELQRVLLASALTQESKCLILDEPTSSLDPKASKTFFRICANLINEHNTHIICSTHALNEISVLSDQIIALKNATLYALSTTSDFLKKEVLEDLYESSFSIARSEKEHREIIF